MEEWKTRVYSSYGESGAENRALERWQYLRRYSQFLPSDKATPILDIGCGTGTFVEALGSIGYSCAEGVDLSDKQVEAATARGLTRVSQGAALDYLRERPNRYGLITAFSVLEHQTRPELFELLDAVRGALHPGGTLIAVVPNAKGLFGAHVRFADITHESSFTPSSVHQICTVAGLELITIFEHGPLVHGLPSAVRWAAWQSIRAALRVARIAEGADWQWPVFTQDLVFVARKPPTAA
jgi:2-polyprenyl-3-methyl-5-hydroxy-6-metoxy-1,4-benzoquinol methylase